MAKNGGRAVILRNKAQICGNLSCYNILDRSFGIRLRLPINLLGSRETKEPNQDMRP
jgi:hypothetical protein